MEMLVISILTITLSLFKIDLIVWKLATYNHIVAFKHRLK